MTISGALSSALSGLTATARRAEIVSSNIANAMTEGYARRELQLSARAIGGSGQGVSVMGVTRAVDPALAAERRLSAAAAGEGEVRAAFLRQLETAWGTPGEEASVGARLATLEQRLAEAAARPDTEPRLAGVLGAAQDLAQAIGRVGEAVQTARATADRKIAAEVGRLNEQLERVAELNRKIQRAGQAGRDISALLDQRQQAVDQIADLVPLRELPRDSGAIALYTTGGLALVEGRATRLGFVQAGAVAPERTLGNGLSGLTANGREVTTGGASSPVAGGGLAALFALRDEAAVTAQAQIDGFARDLGERMAAADPTLAPGAAGLFTDAGRPIDAARGVGLAQRLEVAAAADPAQGGALWRLRDGLGAATPGPAGRAAGLIGLATALTDRRVPAAFPADAAPRSLGVLAADLLSTVATARVRSEAQVAAGRAQLAALTELEAQGGVDTDAELQTLLLVEQGYAANAKVIRSIDEMIQALLGI
jgi:flagellar hook-associated protein 1 FlgK